MQEEGENGEEGEDEELSLTEFLRTSSDILTSEESAPIIKFVNALFYQAVKRKASDIHIEVHEKRGEVRFRVDGILSKNVDLEKKVSPLLSAVSKSSQTLTSLKTAYLKMDVHRSRSRVRP